MHKANMEHASYKDRTAHTSYTRLPYFDDSKDKINNYLSRFKNYTTANNWDI